jgi:hypothetical protein
MKVLHSGARRFMGFTEFFNSRERAHEALRRVSREDEPLFVGSLREKNNPRDPDEPPRGFMMFIPEYQLDSFLPEHPDDYEDQGEE